MTAARASVLLGLVAVLTAACAETRQLGAYSPPITVTHEEGLAIDQAEKEVSAAPHDSHRACETWKGLLARSNPKLEGLNAYAGSRAKSDCIEPAEQLLTKAKASIDASTKDASSLPAQREAARATDAFLATQWVSAGENRTAEELFVNVRPALQRLLAEDASCDDKKLVPSIMWKMGQKADATTIYVDKARACIGAAEATQILGLKREKGQCDEGVALVAEVFPRARAKEEQIALLDAVMSCSDSFSLRRNFSFAPREILADYQALLSQRKLDRLREDLADQRREATDRCQSDCMTMYAENGVCLNACHGESSCVKNCRLLSDACDRNCR